MNDHVIVYTDGGCVPNPGNGGWGAVLMCKNREAEIFGGEPNTTNNRMELLAAIKALNYLKRPCDVTLYSDSKYVVDGITKWYPNWIKTGRTNFVNPDLWHQLAAASKPHNIDWQWVKGHSGVPGNERADELAMRAIEYC
jgi:ribonuclease HI